jgi:hypothetical protein
LLSVPLLPLVSLSPSAITTVRSGSAAAVVAAQLSW